MDRKHVKPAPGMKVRFEDPSRGYIPADGVEVPLTSYYRRRKRDGDLLAAPQTKAGEGSLTMGSIAFNEIPRTIRAPGVFVEFDSSQASASAVDFRSLVIGQRLASGAIAAGVPRLMGGQGDARRDFGAGSMIERMVGAFRRNNPIGELWGVALEDAAGAVQQTVTVTVTGAATGAGTIALYIAGQRVAVRIDGAATVSEIATAIHNAVTALGATLPVTSGVAAAVVTLTSRNGGAASDIDVRLNYFPDDALPAGVAITVAVDTAGATDPDIQDALDALSDGKYNVIAHPYSGAASMATLESELRQRWGPLLRADGVAITGLRGTVAAATTYGNARNSPFSIVMDMATAPTSAPEWAAMTAGRVAQSAEIDPARPFQTLVLNGALPAAIEDQRTFAEQNGLLTDGIATHTVDSGGVVRIQRLITTYQTASGVPDEAYLDANTPLTLSFLRADFANRMATKYARFKLADDGTRFAPGQPIITPAIGRAEAIAWFGLQEERGLVGGPRAVQGGAHRRTERFLTAIDSTSGCRRILSISSASSARKFSSSSEGLTHGASRRHDLFQDRRGPAPGQGFVHVPPGHPEARGGAWFGPRPSRVHGSSAGVVHRGHHHRFGRPGCPIRSSASRTQP